MTREEARKLTERLADAVARYAKSQHGQARTDYQAQADAYNAQNEIIAALAPAPSPDDVALVDDFLSAHRSVWANTGDDAERYEYRKEADAARAALLARLSRAPTVPEGWQLVPVVPTEEMLAATCDENRRPRVLEFTKPEDRSKPYLMARYIYPAMLAAAPKVPA